MSTTRESYKEIAAENNLNIDEFVSSWADAEDATESLICYMILRGHGEWPVKANKDIVAMRSYQAAGKTRTYESHDHSEILDVHGCTVIFRYGMPDSIWYLKSDEAKLLELAKIEQEQTEKVEESMREFDDKSEFETYIITKFGQFTIIGDNIGCDTYVVNGVEVAYWNEGAEDNEDFGTLAQAK